MADSLAGHATEKPEKTAVQTSDFQIGHVASISGGHFIHDMYSGFLAPLIPFLVDKLSISLTLAGSLTLFQQLPALLNPFIGYLADRVSLRYLVIFAPAVTATTMSALGLAPNYVVIGLLLFVTGIASACFHAPAPAMIGRISGKQVGTGMSLFMAAGEFGRAIGPLLAVWAATTLTLEGTYRIAALGWGATAVLFWRLRKIPARSEPPGSVSAILPSVWRVFLPLVVFLFFRNFVSVGLQIYLPTFVGEESGSAVFGGVALFWLELAGVGGALLSGTLSDRLGRTRVLTLATLGSSLFMLLFLAASEKALVPALIGLGFMTFSSNPVILSIVQDNFKENRALANGLWIALAFAIRPLHATLLGYAGDTIGLRTAYLWSAGIALLALLPLAWLSKADGAKNPRGEQLPG